MPYDLSKKLKIAVTTRVLFCLESENTIFETQGKTAYEEYQIASEKIYSQIAIASCNNPEMFVNSLFPDKFKDIVTRCFLENNDSFQKLINDPEFYQRVMEEMAKELYKRLRKD